MNFIPSEGWRIRATRARSPVMLSPEERALNDQLREALISQFRAGIIQPYTPGNVEPAMLGSEISNVNPARARGLSPEAHGRNLAIRMDRARVRRREERRRARPEFNTFTGETNLAARCTICFNASPAYRGNQCGCILFCANCVKDMLERGDGRCPHCRVDLVALLRSSGRKRKSVKKFDNSP